MPIAFTGKPQLSRRVNRALILSRIRTDGVTSRADLAKITAIKPPTVSAVVKDLIDEGLVVETGNGKTRGGRAPRMIALSQEHGQAIGFEITDTAILGGLCDLGGNLLAKRSIDYSPDTPERTLERLTEMGDELLRRHGAASGGPARGWSDLQGAGIAVPGLIDAKKGIVRWSHPLAWRDVPLAAMCKERWSARTTIVNDSVAGSMAAHFFGPQDVRNLVHVVLRFRDASNGVVGIGTAIIVRGEPYSGEFGTAGEITTPIRHPLEDARDEQGRRFQDVPSYVAALRSAAPSASRALDRVASEISLLLMHAINLLEPGRLILEVDVPELGQALWKPIRAKLDEYTLRRESAGTEVLLSNLGDYGGVRGAIVPALMRIFRLRRWG